MSIALISLFLVCIVALGLLFRNSNAAPSLNPYSSKKPLTPTEAIFYRRLVEALPSCVVLPQVQLSRFIDVDRTSTGSDFYTYFNPIAQQSVDYLICLEDFTIVAAVELDDKSHNTATAKLRDDKKTRSLQAADIPLIRWHAEAMPTIEQIRLRFVEDNKTEGGQPENNWLTEDQEAYFRRTGHHTQNQDVLQNVMWWTLHTHTAGIFSSGSKVIPKVFTLIGVVIVGLIAINLAIPMLTESIQTIATLPQQIVAPSINVIQQRQAERQPQANEDLRRQKEFSQERIQESQTRIEAERQLKLELLHETAAKEKAWQAYYRKSQECKMTGNLITCGNDYAKAKKEFETIWADKSNNQ